MSESPPLYPCAVIAKLLLLTERRVQQLSTEGVIPRSERGRYPLAGAIQGYIKYLKDRTVGSVDVELGDIGSYKARLIKARARTAELEADQLQGRLLVRAEVEQAWKTILLNMRAKLMAIPTRAAPQVVAGSSIVQIAALLELLVSEALNELAVQPLEAAAAAVPGDTGTDRHGAGGTDDVGAATEADGIGVG